MDPLAGKREAVPASLEECERLIAAEELDRRLAEIRDSGRKVGVRETLLLADLSARAGKPLDSAVQFTPEAARFKRLCSPARRGKVAR